MKKLITKRLNEKNRTNLYDDVYVKNDVEKILESLILTLEHEINDIKVDSHTLLELSSFDAIKTKVLQFIIYNQKKPNGNCANLVNELDKDLDSLRNELGTDKRISSLITKFQQELVKLSNQTL